MAQVAMENLRVRNLRATAAPVSGTFALGDTVWNTDPADGDPIGWVCVTAGTPGTWVQFGQIGAAASGAATDAIWDAKGDLAVATAANTAAKLTVGANTTVLTADSAEATGLKWSPPITNVAQGRPKSATEIAYSLPGIEVATRGSRTLAANRLYYEPRIVDTEITLDRLAIEVTVVGSGSAEARFGIFTATTDWQPSALVVQSASFDVSSVGGIGVKAETVSTTLSPGRYLFAVHSNSNPQLRCGFGGQRLAGYGPALGSNTFNGSLYKSSVTYAALDGTAWDVMAGDTAMMGHAVFCRVSSFGTSSPSQDHSHPAEKLSTVTASGATETLDVGFATVHDVKLDANCTLTFTGAVSTASYSFTLVLRQDATGSRTVTWPASVDWPGGAPPTLTTAANGVEMLTFITVDGGTTWLGNVAGQAFS